MYFGVKFYPLTNNLIHLQTEESRMESIPSKYTFNQKGAIVAVFFAAVWTLLSM